MSAAPTIAELYQLADNDPWDRRTPEQQAQDAERSDLTINQPAKIASGFDEPPDNANLWIDDTDRLYSRLMVRDKKLTELLQIEPALIAIGVAAGNLESGCWIALTSQRVAQQLVDRLGAQGMAIELQLVDGDGNLHSGELTDAQYKAIETWILAEGKE